MNKKNIEKKLNIILKGQKNTSDVAVVAKYAVIGLLLAIIPGSLYSLLTLTYTVLLFLYGGLLINFSIYILAYAAYSQLEIIELYYITLLKGLKK